MKSKATFHLEQMKMSQAQKQVLPIDLQYKVVKVAVTKVFQSKPNQMIKTAISINSKVSSNIFVCQLIVKFVFNTNKVVFIKFKFNLFI